MASSLLLSVENAAVAFSGKPVFESLSFHIHAGNKIALVGANGAGKSTLMRMITGEQELDAGTRWQEPGIAVGYLKQEVIPKAGETVFDYILEEITA
ncbi:MAG: ABC-F family ATP-binding cassette domain-containing protein, partial [Alphaproteobacteria bacterium]